MPKVKRGESEKDYVARCVPYVVKNEGAKPDQAAAKCHGMWRQAQHKQDFESTYSDYHMQANDYELRTEIHEGKKHLIVPVVMMVEGVHNGSHGPLLHPADELGRFLDAWNGIPVCVEHPEVEGVNVSARTPQMIDERKVGRVYNTRIEDGKLKAEVWLDEQRLQQASQLAFDYIRQKRQLDVSVGVFTEEEEAQGAWNGEGYVAIARNHHPDHLALLPGGTGACSWQDGCGIRLNESFEPPEAGNAPAGVKSILNRVYKGCRSRYVKDHPNDRENAANKTSCSRIAWHAVEQAGWRKRGGRWIKTQEEGGETMDMELMETFKQLGSVGYGVITNDQGYREVTQAIQGRLDGMDDSLKFHFLQEVYDDFFVYEVRPKEGASFQPVLYKMGYEMKDNGSVEFSGEPQTVRRKTEYVAYTENFERKLKDTKEVNSMSQIDKKKVDALIESKENPFQEDDRKWLENLEEDCFERVGSYKFVVQAVDDDDDDDDDEDDKNEGKEPAANKELQTLRENMKDIKTLLPLLPDEVADQIQSGIQLNKERRTRLIEKIGKADAEKNYSEDELKAMSTPDLERLAKFAKVPVDYSLAAHQTQRASGEPPMGRPGIEAKKKED